MLKLISETSFGSRQCGGSADVGSLENVMYFAPTGAGTEDGSSWENAKAFTQENYDAMTAGYTALLLKGTYSITSTIVTVAGKDIYGGFIGSGLTTEDSIVYPGAVPGSDGTSGFSVNSTVFDCAGNCTGFEVHNRIENVVVYRGKGTIWSTGGGFNVIGATCIKCKAVNCFVESAGGGFYITDDNAAISSVIDCEAINCKVQAQLNQWVGQGAGFSLAGWYSNQVINCKAKGCYITYGHGAGFYTDAQGYLEGCLAEDCYVEGGGYSGGGFYVGRLNVGNVVAVNCTAKRCKTETGESYGGGFAGDNSITGCTAIECSTGKYGGGFYCSKTLVDCKAIQCTAGNSGGGFAVPAGAVLTGCTSIDCVATISGGGFYALDTEFFVPTLTNLSAIGCYAGSSYADTNYGIIFSHNNVIGALKGSMYTAIKAKTIADTAVETSLLNMNTGEYVRSNVIPANSLKPGDAIEMKLKGIISTDNVAPDTTLKILFGSAVLITSAKTLSQSWNAVYFEMNAKITINSIGETGEAIIGGNTLFKDDSTVSAGLQRALNGVEVQINTTVDNAIDGTYTWGTASANNTITIKQARIKINV